MNITSEVISVNKFDEKYACKSTKASFITFFIFKMMISCYLPLHFYHRMMTKFEYAHLQTILSREFHPSLFAKYSQAVFSVGFLFTIKFKINSLKIEVCVIN